VELFNTFTAPAIVLLDINMPKMDGYQACTEMRAIEKANKARGHSQIIAVTALGGEMERHRGLVE
jgi:CheY-like chemotaxis protein